MAWKADSLHEFCPSLPYMKQFNVNRKKGMHLEVFQTLRHPCHLGVVRPLDMLARAWLFSLEELVKIGTWCMSMQEA